MNIKKIIVTGASLLMFASVGAGIGLNNTDVSAKSGRVVRYVGKSEHIGNGNSRKTWLLHGQRLKLDNYIMRDGNGVKWSASQDGFVRLSDLRPLHHYHYHKRLRKHFRKHARKRYRKAGKHTRRYLRRHAHKR